jgi:hypothetical protein
LPELLPGGITTSLKRTKKRLGSCFMEIVMMNGSELWVENKSKKKDKLQAVEMNCLQRSSSKSKLERVPNEEIRRTMQAEETVLDRIEARKLRWLGHVMRMPEERWPAVIPSWIPPGRRKRERPSRSWLDGITKVMKKRGMGKKKPRTGYFGEEYWEGGGQPYKPISIYRPRWRQYGPPKC